MAREQRDRGEALVWETEIAVLEPDYGVDDIPPPGGESLKDTASNSVRIKTLLAGCVFMPCTSASRVP